MSDEPEKQSRPTPDQPDSPHKSLVNIMGGIATAACITFIIGELWSGGNAWPAAVAASGICVMGVFTAYFLTRRS